MSAAFQTTSLTGLDIVDEAALPAPVRRAPSMMNADERRLLFSLGLNHFSGYGRIVDAGVFLGGSSICFGAALQARGLIFDRAPIISYDLALVTPGMMNFFRRKGLYPDLKLNDDLRPIIRKNTKDYSDLIDYRFGDICDETYEGDADIEILFLDLLKTYDVNRHVFKAFLPKVKVGGLVIQQDYFYHHLPYIKIYQENLANHFEYLGMARTSAIYRCVTPVSADAAGVDLYAERSRDDLLTLHDQAAARSTIDKGRQMMCALSRVELLAELRDADAARSEFKKVRTEYSEFLSSDDFARKVLDQFSHVNRLTLRA